MPQHQRGDGQHEHQAAGHELPGLAQPDGEHDKQGRQQNIHHGRLKDDPRRTQAQGRPESGGHDERNLAARLQETHHAADDQQDDVNPENERCVMMHKVAAVTLT